MATLAVLQGPDKGRKYQANDDVVEVGRGSSQLPLTDQTVSRRHIELTRANGVWIVRDLNSANGTYVNGKRIQEPRRLKSGDQIKIGRTVMVYTSDDSVEQISGDNIPSDLVRIETAEDAAPKSVVKSVASSDDSVVIAAPEAATAVRAWRVMRDLTDVIGTLTAPEQLLQRVMEIIFEEVQADRGVILLRDEETDELLPVVVRFKDRKVRTEATRKAITASRTVVDQVLQTHKAVIVENATEDERFHRDGAAAALEERSVICAPIVAREQILGVIHLDSQASEHTYTEHELRLITAIGYQTGLAIENTRLVQAHLERERLAATGETVAYLSHSIKNVLQGMRAGADVVQRGLDRRDFSFMTQGWRILDRNLDKVYRLMLNMLAFSTKREPHLELRPVNKVCEEVAELVQKQADEVRVQIRTDLDADAPPIPVDEDGLHQVVLNLVENALDVVPHDTGLITVRTSFDEVERWMTISVVDNGPGVLKADRSRIFDPFFSTKGHGGTGLGLAVSRKITTEMGGTIELTSPPDGGAEFFVRLPSAEARPSEPGETRRPVR